MLQFQRTIMPALGLLLAGALLGGPALADDAQPGSDEFRLSGTVLPEDWWKAGEFDPCIPPERGLPPSYDWRDYGGVTAVQNQGGCGSCWAHAAIACVESKIRIDWGYYTDLSEQWLVSCNQESPPMDCGGGQHYTAFEYLKCCGYVDPCGDSGAVLESDFPYLAQNYYCNCPYIHGHPYCIRRWFFVGNGNSVPAVDSIKTAIYNYGPVAATIYSTPSLQNYPSGFPDGVFDDCYDQTTNHGILIVGWDDDYNGEGVWIIKNSWGTGWGYSGYGYVKYGCSRVGYAAAYVTLSPTHNCDGDGIPDWREICSGSTTDCNDNAIPDECDYDPEDDCNSNGALDACDIQFGTSTDCNENLIPDECDIAEGTSLDCNGNGLPDECDVNGGGSQDCNGNGIPDECDIAGGTAEDCNGNGVPDECDFGGHLTESSGEMTPIGWEYPQSYEMQNVLLAEGPVSIDVDAYGDFNFGSEHLEVYINGTWVDELFAGDVEDNDCPADVPDHDQTILTAAEFNAFAGTGAVTILLEPSSAVGPFDCDPYTWVSLVIDYDAEAYSEDCNANLVPDECELADCPPGEPACDDCNSNGILDECDIASGTSEDTNGNGVPDECDTGQDWCLGDMNCSGGSPDFADIVYFASAVGNEAGWEQYYRDHHGGADPPCPWLLGDYGGGAGVEFSDIVPFANSVGQSCIPY